MRRILHIEHDWGGGIGRHVNDLARFLQDDGIESLRCQPTKSFWLHIERVNFTGPQEPLRLFPSDIQQCVQTIRDLNIFHVHFHSILNYNPFFVDQLLRAIREAGLQYDFTIHDYATICPRVHMTDLGEMYCNVASFSYCDRCVATAGTSFGEVDPRTWRARYLNLLQGARRIFVPNIDVSDRVRNYLGTELDLLVRPHPEPHPQVVNRPRRRSIAADGRRVAIMGGLTVIKGLNVVRAMALDGLRRGLTLRFIIFGQPGSDDLASFPNVEVKGAFEEDDIDAMIQADPPDIAFFPSVCPETHLYALSIAFRNFLFPMAFDIGAQSERIKRATYGAVVPLGMAFIPEQLNDRLATIDLPSIDESDTGARQNIAPWSGIKHYYEFVDM